MKKLLQHLLFVTATLAAGTAMASVTFFETEGFGGQPLTVNGVVPDFRAYDFNDRAMSLVVEGAPVEVCVHVNFGGNCQVFNPGSYPVLGFWAHTISSVRPAYNSYGRHQHRDYQRDYDRDDYRRDDYDRDNYRRDDHYRDGYAQRGRDRWNEPRYRYGGY